LLGGGAAREIVAGGVVRHGDGGFEVVFEGICGQGDAELVHLFVGHVAGVAAVGRRVLQPEEGFELVHSFFTDAAFLPGLAEQTALFGPFGELLFFGVFGVGFFVGEPIAFELDEVGVELGAAEAGDVGAEFAKAVPLGAGVVGGEGAGGGGVLEGEPAGEFIGEIGGEGGVGGVVFVFEVLDELEGVLADGPIAEAAFSPFGEVLFGDGAGIELGGEEGFDFGEAVEPGEDGFGGSVLVQSLIELVTDGAREASDFTGAGGGG